MKKLNIVLILFFVLSKLSYTQSQSPEKDFISPVKIPISLSGTFGELRSNHFHAGIDIRTESVEGHKVVVVGDGWISRIKVSPVGYGKAIYVTHPNGYTSVYAHLKCFNDSIEKFVREIQYEKESFAVDISVKKNLLPLKQGDVIALGGNTGGSMGPHLHFEIRDTKTQRPVNPLLLGYEVADTRFPVIKSLELVPLSPRSYVNGKHNDAKLRLKRTNGVGKVFRSPDTIRVSGEFGLAVSTYDQLNGAPNKNGVYQVKLFLDDSIVYSHRAESFSFAQSRYINALIDYPKYIDKKIRYQRSWIEPGNKLDIYQNVVDKGIQKLSDNRVHWFRYEISDVAGNITTIKIPVVQDTAVYEPFVPVEDEAFRYDNFDFRKPNHFINEFVNVSLPANALYNDIQFEYAHSDSLVNEFGRLYRIHNNSEPLHKSFVISVKPDTVPEELQRKIQFVRVDDRDSSYCGGKWVDGRLEARLRNFGDYFIDADTVNPSIKMLNIVDGQTVNLKDTLKIEIIDRHSGIDSYRLKLNKKWVLAEYDAKNDLLFYVADDQLQKSDNLFKLFVSDVVGNFSELQFIVKH